ncbi:MAG: hypothetical protein AAFY59_05720, partial [Pseudomonadota bacterium]
MADLSGLDGLLALPAEDGPEISALRGAGGMALGFALAEAGCGVEAAKLLRPCRKEWGGRAEQGAAVLAANAWWNREWRGFAQAVQADRVGEALALLGDGARWHWDRPPLLMHLGHVALGAGALDLAERVFARVVYLAGRGVPGIEMTAFAYAGPAALVDVKLAR